MLAICILVGGCASSDVSKRRRYVHPDSVSKPSRVLVLDFAVTSDDVRSHLATDVHYVKPKQSPSADDIERGRKLADFLAEEVVSGLRELGMNARRARSASEALPSDLLIDGAFVSLDKGSRIKRMVIGFGSGAAELNTHVAVYQKTKRGIRPLGGMDVKAEGGKMPGVLVPVAGGAAAGSVAAAIAVSGGMNVAQEVGPESLEGAAKRTASEIVGELAFAFDRRGWLP